MKYQMIGYVEFNKKQCQRIPANRETEVVLGAVSSALSYECNSIYPEVHHIGNIPTTTEVIDINRQIIRRNLSKSRFVYEVKIELRGGAFYSIVVEACSKEEAIALATCRLKQAVCVIPKNRIVLDLDEMCDNIYYTVEEASCDHSINYRGDQDFFTYPNRSRFYEPQCQSDWVKDLQNRRQIIIEAFNLNPIEETYVFDQPYCCMADTLHNRICEVLAWR